MNALIRPVVLFVATMTGRTWWEFSRGTCSVVEPDEIDVFVQAVLATADRTALGLPKPSGVRAPAARRRRPDDATAVADGNLPADLQRYLERLVSVSSAADGHRLVSVLWDGDGDGDDDDGTVVDVGDAEPHDVFDRYNGRTGVGRQTSTTTTTTTTTTITTTTANTTNKTTVDGKRAAASSGVTVFE